MRSLYNPPSRVGDKRGSIMLELLNRILDRIRSGEAVALCVVVGARGSTPQEKGAAMLVLEDGKTLGTLGGGCVEAEVRTQALRWMRDGAGRLLSYRLDHDYGWDDGLVCGGTMDIAVQIVRSAVDAQLIQQASDDLSHRRAAKLEIAVADESGTAVKYPIVLLPSPSLLIAGAGHVAQALASAAANVDFQTAVIDDRADFASPARFPTARCIVGEIEQELAKFPIDPETFVTIATRGHRHDAAALAAVIRSPAKYVGLIGSRRKVFTILADLHSRGVPRELLAKIHAPIGFEIGALTPAEIAVSILAELIAVRRGRDGQPALPMKIPNDHIDRFLKQKQS
jgi:xanthine dehydrogenase accessory factor